LIQLVFNRQLLNYPSLLSLPWQPLGAASGASVFSSLVTSGADVSVWPLLLLLALSGAATGCDSAPLVSWWHSVVEVFGQASARGKKNFEFQGELVIGTSGNFWMITLTIQPKQKIRF